MASHDVCNHPATPAARARCRASGGPKPGDADALREAIHGPAETVTWTVTPRRTRGARAAASVALKRPNTRLRTIGDLTDVPPALAVIVRKAWDIDGWEVRTGDPYVADERRVLVTTPHGELALVWRPVGSSRPGVHALWWRPKGTSVHQKIDTVNGALRLANGEDE